MENQEKQPEDVKKPIGVPFTPGHSGNPAGRPKKVTGLWQDIIDEILSSHDVRLSLKTDPEKKPGKAGRPRRRVTTIDLTAGEQKSFRHALTVTELNLAMHGNMEAVKDLLDRDLGKPKQHIDQTTNGRDINQLSLPVIDLSEEEKKTIRSAVRRASDQCQQPPQPPQN